MVVPHLRYGALSGAQDREKADPGMITRGPLTVSLHRRSRRREVVAAGTFLEASQHPTTDPPPPRWTESPGSAGTLI